MNIRAPRRNQISNLLYRGFPTRWRARWFRYAADWKAAIQQIGNLLGNLHCQLPVRFFGTCGLVFWTCSLLSAPRPPWTSNRVIGSPNPPAPYTVERLFPKLAFTNPVDIAVLPGSERLLVLEQAGKLLSFPNRPDVDRTDLVFDFRKHHEPQSPH